MKFYEQFIKLCETNNVKPTPLLSELGISKNSWQNWRDGSAVKSDTLELLANHFNVSVDYLLGRTTEPAQQIMNNREVGKAVQAHTYNAGAEETKLDETSAELLEQFKKLSLKNKGEAIRVICEMAEAEKENK